MNTKNLSASVLLVACATGTSILTGCASSSGSVPVATVESEAVVTPETARQNSLDWSNPWESDRPRGEGMARGASEDAGDQAEEPRPARQQETVRISEPRVMPARGQNVVSMAYPTGDISTSAVLVEKILPTSVSVGEAFDYEIRVTNLSSLQLDNVRVSDSMAGEMTILSMDPDAASMTDGVATWVLNSMDAGEQRSIMIRGAVDSAGSIDGCATVAYDAALCSELTIVEPALQLVKNAPVQSLLCDEMLFEYEVTNSGTGVATNVTIEDPLPNGWTTASGANDVLVDVGDLLPGETRAYAVRVVANQPGEFESRAVAMGGNDLTAESQVTQTAILQPELSLTVECPEQRYLDRNAAYTVTVENTGNGPATNTVVSATIPTTIGSEFVSATGNGVVRNGMVIWDAGTLEAGATRTFEFRIQANQRGSAATNVTVNAACAEEVTASCSTNFVGIPALLLEVIDVVDPVEVGEQTQYVIEVTNQGTADGTEIVITAELPASQRLVATDGPTAANVNGRVITFAALPELDPGATVRWTVTVEAVEEADARFRVSMDAAELTSSVDETEATNLYR
jgi:uncharacterized repeat protein (TIGR01451 family)